MPLMVRNVVVADRQGRIILQHIHATLPDAAVTLLVGRNGAGKSTLLDAMSGLIQPAKGTIHYDDLPLWIGNKLNSEVLRSIGNVFQYPEQQLFAPTVEREVAYSLRYLKLPQDEVEKRTVASLERMRLPQRLRRESPHLLSGGQKRRVALASTIAPQPKWLLLDEPTAGLDAEGVSALLEFIEQARSMGCSVVIATHDLETMLPYADHIVVLQSGRVAAQIKRDDMAKMADTLEQAGLAVPASLKLADMLRHTGLRLANPCPSPQELADAIARAHGSKTIRDHMSQSCAQSPCCNECQSQPSSAPFQPGLTLPPSSAASFQPSSMPSQPDQQPEDNSAIPIFLIRLDPRAKWLFYMMLSVGILVQGHWLGLAAGMVVSILLILYARVPLRSMVKLSIPLLLLFVASVLVSGFASGGDLQLHMASSWRTLFELLKIWIVSMLGLALAMTTSQLMMKQAIERSLRVLQHFRLPVGAIALGASLMLRFIPVLAQEYRRFSKIVKARSKDPAHKEGIRFRQLAPMMIPLILSLFQLASDLTIAMQARGLRDFRTPRTSSYELKMTSTDWKVVVVGLLVFALFVL